MRGGNLTTCAGFGYAGSCVQFPEKSYSRQVGE
jgi:hypothetical protein